MLRLSIDERDELEEETEGSCDGIPFIAADFVISSYGERFDIAFDEKEGLTVTSLDHKDAKAASLFRTN